MHILSKKTFAALLLFQFRTQVGKRINKKRVCEEKIFHIKSATPDEAYDKAISIGNDEEFSYQDNNKKIYFDFIGIVDIVEMPEIEEDNVVWSRFVEKVKPMERKNKIIPPKHKLSVFKDPKGKLKV